MCAGKCRCGCSGEEPWLEVGCGSSILNGLHAVFDACASILTHPTMCVSTSEADLMSAEQHESSYPSDSMNLRLGNEKYPSNRVVYLQASTGVTCELWNEVETLGKSKF